MELRAQPGYRFVARDVVGDDEPTGVLTVWLGTDQGLGDADAPLIFGTIARDVVGGQFLEHTERFSTNESDAFAAHAALLEQLERRGVHAR